MRETRTLDCCKGFSCSHWERMPLVYEIKIIWAVVWDFSQIRGKQPRHFDVIFLWHMVRIAVASVERPCVPDR